MPHYIGRFAPSPTGLLHIGSLLTAIASYADARAHGGQWLLRMEDLDPPREMAGAADNILFTLEQFGFEWDGAVAYQSQRHALYRAALGSLKTAGLAYPCYCSRKDWHAAAQMGVDGFVYNGACRPNNVFRLHQNTRKTPAWRMMVRDETIAFEDEIVGHYAQNLAHDIGDFVLLRADGYWAYQLAVVVDDAAQGITHIVRGQDLLVSTPRQMYLQRSLKMPTPHYAHLPQTNARPRAGFGGTRNLAPPSVRVSWHSTRARSEPTARGVGLGGGAMGYGARAQAGDLHGVGFQAAFFRDVVFRLH